MEKKELLECIDFFKELKVFETDVTTDEEKANHNKVVVANYSFKGQSFTTNKLYYKNILHQENVKNPQNIIKYFGGDVYWLDKDLNDWAKGSGEAELEKTIIDEMVVGDDKGFKTLLKTIANNHKTGFIQRITAEGKTGQYHHNFENNNHWHDIILLIQEIINKRGAKVDKRLFSRLVFKWDGDKNTERERSSLAKEVEWKSRAFIDNLYQNIKSIQNIIADMEIINILTQKKQIILQGPPGTGKTFTAKDIAEQMLFSKVSDDKKQQKALLESTEQFKLIQFHPAYSYEDFVRGIVVKTDISTIPEYRTVNKILGEFARKANESNLSGGTDDFDRAWYDLVQNINDGKVTKIGSSDVEVDINTQGNIRFKSPVATYEKTYELYKFGKTDLKYETYHKIVLNYLKDTKGIYKMKDYVSPKSISSNKPYVLIIDEINRANLPAVLGELIYALEYRGEKVESMYATLEEGNTLILPPNLYIIGTMNTSDRSVGHIDYAIRRRFAFIDVLPKVLEGDNFELELFKQVSALFIQNFDEYVQDNTVELKISEHLSEEFRPEDVWLGHSYFIKNESDFALRKKYEIVPILKEYVKDGILKQSAEPIINAL
jgi:Cdc6-like AAA superfamily ATPase